MRNAGRILLPLLSLAGTLLATDDSVPLSRWAAPPYWLAHGEEADAHTRSRTPLLAPATPLPFVAITPCRLADTRPPYGFAPPYGPPALSGGSPRDFTIMGPCGIPPTAQAVSFNFTAVSAAGAGFLLVFPAGTSAPNVSTLNYTAGQTVANAAVVPLGTGGAITVVAGVSGTDLLIDVNGYYAPQAVVTSLNALSGDLALAPGSNISITPAGNTLTVSASVSAGPSGPTGPTGPSGPAGVDGSSVLSLFGDGSDGDVILPADTSIGRDAYFGDLTIGPGVTLSPNGFRIFVRGTLVLGAGAAIQRNGNDAPGFVGAHGPALAAGTLGGSGGGNTGGSCDGDSVTDSLGGSGGGFFHGSATPPPVTAGGTDIFRSAAQAVTGRTLTGAVVTGGAGGGGNGPCAAGGGGGGGVVVVAARTILVPSGSAVISANGGVGSFNGGSSSGGGGGGVVVIVTASPLPGGLATSVAGGSALILGVGNPGRVFVLN